jgi:hypothetical protein
MQLARFVRAALVSALSAASMLAAQAQTVAGDEIDIGVYYTVDTGYGVGPDLRIRTGRSVHRREPVFGDQKIYSSIFAINVDALNFEVDFLTLAGWQEGVVLRLTDIDFREVPYPVLPRHRLRREQPRRPFHGPPTLPIRSKWPGAARNSTKTPTSRSFSARSPVTPSPGAGDVGAHAGRLVGWSAPSRAAAGGS